MMNMQKNWHTHTVHYITSILKTVCAIVTMLGPICSNSEYIQLQYFLSLLYLKGTRFSDGDGSSNEVQRTMLELINQLDGFDPRGNIKVLMATNR